MPPRRSKPRAGRPNGIGLTSAATVSPNHGIHIAAITQIGNDTPGRAYYQRELDEGKIKKE
jgi:hypothetical protein